MDRPNVELVTESIREVRSDAIVALDGTEHKADCIIFGTGFAATEFLVPIRITGAGGDLHQCWRDGAQAHLGITVAGFPNFFMLYGPNTNLAHNSIVYMLESQIRYVVACLKRLGRDEIRTIEVRPEIQQRSNARLQPRLKRTVWAKGCTSWYQTAAGRNTNNWPGYTFAFGWRPARRDGTSMLSDSAELSPSGVRERVVASRCASRSGAAQARAFAWRADLGAALVAASARAAEPTGARRRDRARAVGGITGEWLRATSNGSRTILYLHGGGFCTGSPRRTARSRRGLPARPACRCSPPTTASRRSIRFRPPSRMRSPPIGRCPRPGRSSSRAIPPARGSLW